MNFTDPSLAPLLDLSWQTLDVILRNTSNKYARSSPLVILDGVLMTLAPPEMKPPNQPRRFLHVTHMEMGRQIYKGKDYAFRVLFLNCGAREISAFVAGLHAPIQNFALIQCSPVRTESMQALLSRQQWHPEQNEVCLNFQTLLDFDPPDRTRPWLLTAPQFGSLLLKRIEKVFEVQLPGALEAWNEVELLPYYWRADELIAESRSVGGQRRFIGNAGPLFVRGNLERVWPLLLLAAQIPLGSRYPGLGACTLESGKPLFAKALCEPETYQAAHEELLARHDPPDEFHNALNDPKTAAVELAGSVAGNTWEPMPARGFRVRKENGGARLIVQLAPRDFVIQKAVQQLLAPVFDRMFEPASVGYRPGHSPATIRERIRNAYRDGAVWALKADVEEFFDQIDWEILLQKVQGLVPLADKLLLETLAKVLHTPVVVNGSPLVRERGLLQGSPLSPLLSNVYLDGFDEQMQQRGLCHVRFADDLLVLCHSEAEAQSALETVHTLLAPLKLRLNEAKTALLPCDAGFQFLNQTYGGGLDPAALAEASARRTLYVREPYAWAGVDHDALVVRAKGELVARVPLRRLDNVVLMGAGGVSARLTERLNEWGLPLTFCTNAGRPINMLLPRSREHLETAAAHAARHAALNEAGRLEVARRIVQAKLHNQTAWLAELPGPDARVSADIISKCLRKLKTAATIDQLRGHEGIASAALFRLNNSRAAEEWHSEARVPGDRHDPWNSLLDFSSHLFFGRLLMLIQRYGMNPWLGFLHSPLNRYESLVYDLMEPFRCRQERFVLKLANRRIIQIGDFEPHPKGGQRLGTPAIARLLEHWERELLTTNSGDPSHLLGLMEAQVLTLRGWVKGNGDFGLYHARKRSRTPPVLPANPKLMNAADTEPINVPEATENEEVPENPLAKD